MWLGEDDTVQGLGCPGRTCVGADGNLYGWVEGVDGLGNPIGFWKLLRRGLRRVAPLVRQFAPLVPGGANAARLTQAMGIGDAGETAQGPDGHLYEWVQGVDGLGNPVGFWKRLKRAARGLVRRTLPLAQQFAPFIPGASAALTVATPYLRQAGLTGTNGLGALFEAPDGSLYQVQGVGADEELQGLDDDELQGLADDDELRGLEDDDELRGFGDDELQGLADEDELRGLNDGEELLGLGDDEFQGYGDDEVQGINGFVRQEGVSGIDAFIPDSPPETPVFRGQSSPMWAPLW